MKYIAECAAFGRLKIARTKFIATAKFPASALMKAPDVNVTWTDVAMQRHSVADIAMAVVTEGGLSRDTILINGEWRSTASGGTQEIGEAVQSTKRAFPAWRKVTADVRRDILYRFAQLLNENAASFSHMLRRQSMAGRGFPLPSGRGRSRLRPDRRLDGAGITPRLQLAVKIGK
ncbi:hypothetical protein J3E64_001879 [Sphingobium sp. OAS761]|uniref:aldehyde dehydrogenase family protein n=1 Tax=Sphingobium sp. OAS761 TaxID=2817901 RepID=UPI00209D106B|nr:aldehyde dehydrogenase family protein [Sphingobium sp. OAS761]MCP1470191.1 hypothetical protein [Sphingobium sp. OAS761]